MKSLQQVLKSISELPHRTFSRELFYSPQKSLSCDCMGFIHILLRESGLTPKDWSFHFKASDLFDFVEVRGAYQEIGQIKKHDILVWKKKTPPLKGDTGHVLLCKRKPQKENDELWRMPIIEWTKWSNGLLEREVFIHTYKDGRIKGIQWHPQDKKVKQTAIFGYPLFKVPKCHSCQKPHPQCLCDEVKAPLWNSPDIVILRHPSEQKHPYASVPILQTFFKNLKVLEGETFSPIEGTLVYPTKETSTSHTSEIKKPLIILDGTWKKSKLILYKNPWLWDLPRVSFTPKEPSEYLVRAQPKMSGLSTLEAFNESWRLLGGKEENIKKIESAFKKFNQRQVQFFPAH